MPCTYGAAYRSSKTTERPLADARQGERNPVKPTVSQGTRTASSPPPPARRQWGDSIVCDTQADAPSFEASGATCIQRLDDSRDSAIHTKYRISLRSSSWRGPRYPLPRVVHFRKYAARAPAEHWIEGPCSNSSPWCAGHPVLLVCWPTLAPTAPAAQPDNPAPSPRGRGPHIDSESRRGESRAKPLRGQDSAREGPGYPTPSNGPCHASGSPSTLL